MNAIGGLLSLGSEPIERGVVSRMSGASQVLLPARRSSWFGGTVGLVCVAAQVDECPASAGLVGSEPRQLALAFDGRLDNRKDLFAELDGHGVGADSRDGDLVLAAYETWGDDCSSRLIGDFAFGLWDGIRCRLLCVRDPLGVRPLYVSLGDGFICFASQLRQILAALPQTPAFNLEFVADRLAHGVDRADADCTPYHGVSRLKPGHRLIVENGRVRTERYWEWRIQCETAGRRHHENLERFQATFFDAVASRMRGARRVWSDLSGGLDSSSVVSAAASLKESSRLHTVSVVFGESTWSDEREWSTPVAQAHRVKQHCIDGDAHHPLSRLREGVQYWEEPHAAASEIPSFCHIDR